MFNNRFIGNTNKISFVIDEWSCTDPDEFQFCRIVDSHTFEYIQLKDTEKMRDSLCIGRQSLAYLDGETCPKDWWQEEIDVEEYSDDEIREYIAPYGGILDGVEEVVVRNQLIAECIFETDVICGEID